MELICSRKKAGSSYTEMWDAKAEMNELRLKDCWGGKEQSRSYYICYFEEEST